MRVLFLTVEHKKVTRTLPSHDATHSCTVSSRSMVTSPASTIDTDEGKGLDVQYSHSKKFTDDLVVILERLRDCYGVVRELEATDSSKLFQISYPFL